MIVKYKQTGLEWPISIERFKESLADFISDYEFVKGTRAEKKFFEKQKVETTSKSSDEQLLLAD